ncbi:MAG: HPP family protein [Gammaproteobacteria bacterium]|nr:HPP family protein [Gammaproteobacteria bacterium]
MTTHPHRTYWNYIWQPFIIFMFLTAILNIFLFAEYTTNVVWAVGVGSLASSAYLVFAKPSAVSAHPMRLIVAYVLAIVCGMLTHYAGESVLTLAHHYFWISFLAALAVVITLLLMIWFKAEHPPAVGMALVFVIDLKDYRTSIIVLGAITILVILKLMLSRWLSDLY